MAISNQAIDPCIEDCLQCIRWCSQCRAESLTEDPVMTRESIRLCSDCLELCRTCVALLTASSEFADRVCGVCANVCEACAAECGKHRQSYAQVCRRLPPMRGLMRRSRASGAASPGCCAGLILVAVTASPLGCVPVSPPALPPNSFSSHASADTSPANPSHAASVHQ
jgi:hypothetical protein